MYISFAENVWSRFVSAQRHFAIVIVASVDGRLFVAEILSQSDFDLQEPITDHNERMSGQRVNVAFLIDTITCDTAGTQRQLLETVRRLDRANYSPRIICLYSSPWLEENEVPCPVTILGYRGFVKLNFWKVVLRLRRIVVREPIHILQTFFDDSIFVAFLATRGISGRCVLISSRRDMGLNGKRPWYHRLFAAALPYVTRHLDSVLCNGHAIKRWVVKRERVLPEKVHVMPNGVSLPPAAEPVPELFDRHPAPLWIGLVASLTPTKRIDVFLRSLRQLADRRPSIQFRGLVLGEGPERDSLLSLADELGISDRVHFTGVVQNVGPYLRQLDIGVLCSDREGLPNAILEYMSYELPVVCTDVGGNVELVDEGVGLRVPVGDGDALAEALIKLADDPALRRQTGSTGKAKVTAHHSWNEVMAELDRYYSGLLKAKSIMSGSRTGYTRGTAKAANQ